MSREKCLANTVAAVDSLASISLPFLFFAAFFLFTSHLIFSNRLPPLYRALCDIIRIAILKASANLFQMLQTLIEIFS